MPRDLLNQPRWTAEDLGKPLPDCPHAASVALPCWDHVVGYEEGRPEILQAMELGYPRFVMHPRVAELFAKFDKEHGRVGERCFAFPSEDVAARCVRYLDRRGWSPRQVDPKDATGIHAVFFQEEGFADAKSFWQHFGKIISSRHAEAVLGGQSAPADGARAKRAVRERIAGYTGAPVENIWLFPSGMAAVSRALRVAQELKPDTKSVQLGFPYVDVLKIQTVEAPGAHFVPEYDLGTVERVLKAEPVSAVICEFPGNPLLRGCSISALADLVHRHGAILIVDDTPSTYFNVNLFPYADFVATSLTKSFSGVGDVMAGGLVLNPQSHIAQDAARRMNTSDEDLLWGGDAVILEENSRDFDARMPLINQTTEALCDWLKDHPAIESVYYPKFTMREAYDEVKRARGGYGGLFSILLKNPATSAPRFYDALEVSKGPSLGNNFTLACPYTLLAHFTELDWAEEHGVSRYLVRVSVGLEPFDVLKTRFARALAYVSEAE